MTAHTPGPWRAWKGPNETVWEILARVTEYGPPMRPIARVSVRHYGNEAEREANARLLAAAPDLLAAAAAFVEYVHGDWLEADVPPGEGRDICREQAKRFVEVIAKATR